MSQTPMGYQFKVNRQRDKREKEQSGDNETGAEKLVVGKNNGKV